MSLICLQIGNRYEILSFPKLLDKSLLERYYNQ